MSCFQPTPPVNVNIHLNIDCFYDDWIATPSAVDAKKKRIRGLDLEKFSFGQVTPSYKKYGNQQIRVGASCLGERDFTLGERVWRAFTGGLVVLFTVFLGLFLPEIRARFEQKHRILVFNDESFGLYHPRPRFLMCSRDQKIRFITDYTPKPDTTPQEIDYNYDIDFD